MELIELISVQLGSTPDCYKVEIKAKLADDADVVTIPYHLSPDDPNGLAPDIRVAVDAWILAGNEVLPVALPPEPSTDPNDYPLQKYQFDLMLRTLGQTVASVETAIDTLITDPAANAEAKSRLNTGGLNERWDRSSPLFDQLGAELGITPTQIDEAWMIAKNFR